MSIKIGSSDIGKVYLGGDEISKIYLGGAEVYNAASYLLDTYTNSSIAYSLRQLSSSTTNVVKVRRDLDNVEQDFTSSEVTDGTLTSFVGAGSGFVSVIYDQSGNNNNGVQTIALSQPKIVDGGSLILDNGKASMLFSGAQSFDFTPFAIDKSDGFYSFHVNTYLGTNNHRIISMGSSNDDFRVGGVMVATRQYGLNGQNIITIGSGLNGSGINELNVYKSNSTSNTIKRDGVQLGTSVNSSTAVFTPTLAKIGGAVTPLPANADGRIKEVIIFNSNQSTNEAGIELDINTYYTIY